VHRVRDHVTNAGRRNPYLSIIRESYDRNAVIFDFRIQYRRLRKGERTHLLAWTR
jgi:hypothetical protein